MTTGEKIKRQRKLLDMKQEDLSKIAGVSLKTIQRWESGERSPRIEEMNKLAEALKVSTGYLIGANEDTGNLSQPEKIPTNEKTSLERKTEIATFISKDGERFEAPATPEGYAYLERMLRLLLGGKSAIATA